MRPIRSTTGPSRRARAYATAPRERPSAVFAGLAGDYAAARPGYPEALFAVIRERLSESAAASPLCLDVAAGAGAATAGLLGGGARVAAVDAAERMLVHARARIGEGRGWIGCVAAHAERLPVPDSAIDLVTVAQAFHWLDERAALAEFARVLRPDGVLAILWNVSEANAFTREVWALVEEMNPGHKRPVHDEKRVTPESLAAHPRFVVEPPVELPHARRLTADAYVRYAFSWSYVGGALEPSERAIFERRLRGILGRHDGAKTHEERLLAVAHLARRR